MKNTYLIYGSDYSLIKRKIKEISSNSKDVVSYDLSNTNVEELLNDASCISLFGDQKVIIGENALFLTASGSLDSQNISYLTDYINADNHDNIVIFYVVADTLDSKRKIVKLFKEKVQIFHVEKIENKDMTKFVVDEFKKFGYKIDYKTASYFVSYVGKNIDIILSEINKMILYKDDNKTVEKEDIINISSRMLKDDIFDLSNAVMKKDTKKIFECLDDLKKSNIADLKILSTLGTQFCFVYQVKLAMEENKNQYDIAKLLNANSYRVKITMESDYMTYELRDIIKKLHTLEYEVKSGLRPLKYALEFFLITL